MDYQKHIDFLDTNPGLERITLYKQDNCKLCIERELFEQTVAERLQKIQQEEAAKAAINAVGSIVRVGMQLAEINELNEIGNAINDM